MVTGLVAKKSRIVVDPAILVGKPTVRGTRIPVSLVLHHLADDLDLEQLSAAFPRLTADDVKACLAFAGQVVAGEEPLVDTTPAISVCGFSLPEPLAHLAGEIERSRSLLDLEDDWDGEGSPGYTEQTWRRAVDLLVRVATDAWRHWRVAVDAVDVVPGAAGGIGLEWRAPAHELLVRIPADPTADAPYYGDDGEGGGKIKGTLVTDKPNRWLAAWFAE